MDPETPDQDLRIVLEALDLRMLCIVKETVFVADKLNDFCKIVKIEQLAEIKNSPRTIESNQLKELRLRFNFDFDCDGDAELTVRCWHWLDELPYKSHTRRELAMMLEGSKPLSVFSVTTQDGLEDEVFAETVFDEYVKNGVFQKYQDHYLEKNPAGGEVTIRNVFYALQGEEWRIKAFLLLRQVAKNSLWNDSFERIEGALLGYSEFESDAYFKLRKRRSGNRLW